MSGAFQDRLGCGHRRADARILTGDASAEDKLTRPEVITTLNRLSKSELRKSMKLLHVEKPFVNLLSGLLPLPW